MSDTGIQERLKILYGEYALETEWKDFEDAVQYSVALLNEIEGIITRNSKDYEQTDIYIWSPEQVLKEYENKKLK